MGQPVNLHAAFSAINSALADLNDGLGARRTFSVPYLDGQQMSDHVNAIGTAATQAGGLLENLCTTSHRSAGRGYGSGDGETVGYSATKLRETIIPEDNELARKAIDATKRFINLAASLIGNSKPEIQTARAIVKLIDNTTGEGMNLLDFNVALQSVVTPILKAVARAHSGKKSGGHSPRLRPPRDGMPQPDDADYFPPDAAQQS